MAYLESTITKALAAWLILIGLGFMAAFPVFIWLVARN